MRSAAPAPTREADLVAILARALRDPAGSPASLGENAAAFVEEASRHRVLVLLGWTLREAGTLDRWPAEFIEAFQRAERDAVTMDAVRHVELARVLDELSAAGARAMLFKGAALAHTHYPAPHVRVRADTDLLVPAPALPALEEVLDRLGYVHPAETAGRLVSYQSHFHKVGRGGVAHAFDVHWKISNQQALADRITHQELWNGRIPLAALGSAAVTADDVHALLLAFVHRAGHHPGSRNLLWIYDLHLLASRLTSEEMSQVREIAAARGLGSIAADGLALARDWFGTRGVDPVIEALRGRAPRPADVHIVEGPWTQARLLRLDLGALPDWRARGRLLREHLFPPASYMRARYGLRFDLWLPAVYLWRLLLGAPKWLQRRTADD